VAETNMVGVAAGLAKAGFKPIVYGLACFVPIRTLEQIKLDVCYEELPVVFIGDGAGLVYSALGSSHQAAEDIAALRAVPHIDILSPCDGEEMQYAMAHALQFARPVYVRMGKSDVGTVHTAPVAVPAGDLVPVRAGAGSRAYIATGSMVVSALRLAESVDGDAPVWSVPVIKPINVRQVEDIAARFDQLVVLEEHNRLGGLGGAIAEIVAGMRGARAHVLRLGIDDRFSQFNGTWEYLRREHGIDFDALRAQVLQSQPQGQP